MDEKQEIDLEESKEDELEDDNESLFDFYVSKIDHASLSKVQQVQLQVLSRHGNPFAAVAPSPFQASNIGVSAVPDFSGNVPLEESSSLVRSVRGAEEVEEEEDEEESDPVKFGEESKECASSVREESRVPYSGPEEGEGEPTNGGASSGEEERTGGEECEEEQVVVICEDTIEEMEGEDEEEECTMEII